jgi:hypothetical protein
MPTSAPCRSWSALDRPTNRPSPSAEKNATPEIEGGQFGTTEAAGEPGQQHRHVPERPAPLPVGWRRAR